MFASIKVVLKNDYYKKIFFCLKYGIRNEGWYIRVTRCWWNGSSGSSVYTLPPTALHLGTLKKYMNPN